MAVGIVDENVNEGPRGRNMNVDKFANRSIKC
jgi:hypothetical protein